MTSRSTIQATVTGGTRTVEITTTRTGPIGAAHCDHVEGPQSKPRFCGWGVGGAPDADILAQQHAADTGHPVMWSFLQVGTAAPV